MISIYIIRHSIQDKNKFMSSNNLEENKLIPLTEEGIIKAKKFFDKKEFKNIKEVYSSDFLRAIKTAEQSNKKVIIDNRFEERIANNSNLAITPQEYFYNQINDLNYSFKESETGLEVQNRMCNGLMEILEKKEDTVIISHAAAITFLLMKFCSVEITDIKNKIRKITFNNKIIFEGKIDYLTGFKLVFDENNNLCEISYFK